MVSLPCVLVFILAFRNCLSSRDNSNAVEENLSLLKCPGSCIDINEVCSEALNETDCKDNQKCCIDEIRTTTDSEFEATTEVFVEDESLVDNADENVEGYVEVEYADLEQNQAEPTEIEDLEDEFQVETSSEGYELPAEMRSEFEGPEDENCPGACVPVQYAEFCEYVIPSADICSSETTCCITEEAATQLQGRAEYEEEQEDLEPSFRRMSQVQNEACPGACIHPAYAMFCENILQGYSCPMNARCCSKSITAEKIIPGSSIVECTGQCLAPNLHGYCFPPNELILGSTTCARGTTCCMRRPQRQGFVSPSQVRFPNQVQPQKLNYQPDVLGYLGTDDTGRIFKVTPSGQISPLPFLTPQNQIGRGFVKVSEFNRPDGKVAIYSDASGALYQQFYRHPQGFPYNKPGMISESSERLAQKAAFIQSAASESTKGQVPEDLIAQPSDLTAAETIRKENLEEIVIPDDDDEAPVSTTTTKKPVEDKELARPPCPGSCMSYFLRFTCFRGYATYDGFSCPGRHVCCARLKDIEAQEEYLKSLSPYYNAPPTTRNPNLPKCGIKGRRDTPRVIGGKESLPGKWCWQTAVINMQNQYICGGALIDNSWVLTAAHCVAGPLKENQSIYVRAGVTDLRSPEDNAASQTIRVLSTFIHHNFNSLNLDNDIALLRLQKPVSLDKNVCVICLPTSGQMPKENTKCIVTGYGFVSQVGTMSLQLKEAEVPIVHDMDCMVNVTEALANPFILPASSFCAGGHGQGDACQGDAGGPLACEIGGFYELAGLVSWGLGCGRTDVPSIYVKVPSFMGWINQIISSSSFLTSLK